MAKFKYEVMINRHSDDNWRKILLSRPSVTETGRRYPNLQRVVINKHSRHSTGIVGIVDTVSIQR